MIKRVGERTIKDIGVSKVVRATKRVNLKRPTVDKQEYYYFMTGYLWSAFDIMRYTQASIYLGGPFFMMAIRKSKRNTKRFFVKVVRALRHGKLREIT